ncbi:hypothetical protein ACJ72_00824 [Emergomyces africanus]|uniref:Mitochondrial distribution and morphology protein 35 n=1 Tax=Emergomyces africanus TaxID=1955775 RepID=A0A1B7P717_9EURO|nr:hypothetical protein ACJ72_00824 [Emergomyces africanus]
MSASLAPECNNIKEKYETCFLKWYSEKYLRGNTTDKDCAKVFEEYQKCLSKTLKERGLDGMVEEARNSNKESDAEFLKRKTCTQQSYNTSESAQRTNSRNRKRITSATSLDETGPLHYQLDLQGDTGEAS